MFWIELALFLACIIIGARIGGIGARELIGAYPAANGPLGRTEMQDAVPISWRRG